MELLYEETFYLPEDIKDRLKRLMLLWKITGNDIDQYLNCGVLSIYFDCKNKFPALKINIFDRYQYQCYLFPDRPSYNTVSLSFLEFEERILSWED